ncbi:putative non-specific lipid-transfer protein-like [Capsicum annuum]|uniref:GDSL esterase/lipase At4g16230-like isoform X1 n=1 Tax=Capsicum annuum TaxID=4072 RepID=UPI0007BF8FD7|nr:GDSL esterase/lipase At4g16230-like isoform X1 [Capsicum annuum]KAF3672363.1 putative non-specific lipid-transfer protein-like [Capsicum annuum]
MMSQKAKTLILSSFLSFLGVCNSACNFGLTNATSTKIKGMFVFGSSLVDNGNNNFLEKCKAKANYLPYGVDYAKGPTGRFTNGKNVIDLLGDHLKLPSLPTFKDPSTKGNVILQGVDFASGGSGILDETGVASGEVMGMNEQIKNMQTVTLPDLENQLGCKSNEALSNYLFLVGTAGNDFSLNFFKNFPHNNATLTGFISKLITGLSQQIQRLYDMGARKFVVMSVYPNGCSPTVRARVPIPVPTGCIHTINVPLSLYNTNLKSLLDYMMQKMPDSKFVYVDVFNIIKNIVQTPSQYGFDNTIDACCEVTPIKEGGNAALCKNGGQVCPSRNKYVWFDGLHPTEAVNIVLANKAFDSELNTEVYPTNVKKLIEG